MKLETPLVGQHLLLSNLDAEHATARYLAWLSDVEVTRHLEIRFAPPDAVDDLAKFIASCNASEDTLMLGIFLRRDGRHIGNIKLGPINRHHGTAGIGLLIGERDEWGKGHACAAIELVSDYAFNNLSLAKLTAGCYAGNEGSRRAFLNAGFAEEGRLVWQWLADGQRLDGILLGKVNPVLQPASY
jgi:ribosomal-protein-alanine N-acetyltransferase